MVQKLITFEKNFRKLCHSRTGNVPPNQDEPNDHHKIEKNIDSVIYLISMQICRADIRPVN